ncbi:MULTISPECIES: S49 family peptidase [unclassified Comamonas]|uniref:S49 family peptidase n=1 Tax=unclassified Comamonas TaxID=2638500 RepID=UPI001FA71388|nr:MULTISPECIES: S49 family peptidase [unclassified Comamonas]UNV89384.1 S49 family peptidase [Comamonas sp. 7D-2evo1]UNV97318.1 S49 family peptidase [Comamonas sp. 7D-2]UNV99028.1 S49 family peptidase [Comamonas sp. 7D-2evo2]
MNAFNFHPHIAQRVFNTPLLMHPQKLDAIIAGVGQRVLGTSAPLIQVGEAAKAELAPEMFTTKRGQRTDRGWRLVDGVAVVNAMGALVHRTRLEADSTLLIGYNDMAADMEDAMAHPDVHAILQVYDTPGGEVAGAFEYGQRIFDMRGRKPIVAIADGMAASAGYLGASAADEVVITSTGYAGSIGVVMRHVDFSRALANEGIQVTHIFAGSHKVDGNPYEPLPVAVREHLQADIEGLYTMFVQAVSKHRGLSEQAIRDTGAAVFRGQAAITAGLASRISTTDALISELSARRARTYPAGGQPAHGTAVSKGAHMSSTAPEAGNQPANSNVATASSAHEARISIAAAPAGQVQASADAARAEGAAAERARVSAILGHPNASANPAITRQCIDTGLTAEQAKGFLDAAPQAVAPAAPAAAGGASEFSKHMAAMGNPAVSGVEAKNGDQGMDSGAIQSSWAGVFGAK